MKGETGLACRDNSGVWCDYRVMPFLPPAKSKYARMLSYMNIDHRPWVEKRALCLVFCSWTAPWGLPYVLFTILATSVFCAQHCETLDLRTNGSWPEASQSCEISFSVVQMAHSLLASRTSAHSTPDIIHNLSSFRTITSPPCNSRQVFAFRISRTHIPDQSFQ